MIALLGVELTRFRWRRAVLLLVATAVVIPAVVFAATAWNTRPVSGAEQQRVQQMIEQEAKQPYIQKQLNRCLDKPQRFGLPTDADVQTACEAMTLPQPEWYSSRSALDLDVERTQGSGLAVAVVLTMLLLLIGTTFVGHDWNSGSMSNQLLFEPRRGRVWAAKGAVVLVAGTVVAGLVLTAYWSGLWLLAEQRDVPIAAGAVSEAYQQDIRAALLAGCAGLGGYALTMLFRSTVATLGILFAMAIAGPLLIALLGFPGNQRLMPQNNFAAIMLDGFTFNDYNRAGCFVDEGGGDQNRGCVVRLTTTDGVVYFGGLLLLAAMSSVLSFRRRDVP